MPSKKRERLYSFTAKDSAGEQHHFTIFKLSSRTWEAECWSGHRHESKLMHPTAVRGDINRIKAELTLLFWLKDVQWSEPTYG